MNDPANTNIDSGQGRERPANGCSQIVTTWLIGLIAVFAFYYLRSLLAEVTSLAAGYIAAPPSLALVFFGGFAKAYRLTPLYVWIAWGVAALPSYIIIGYMAVISGAGRNAGDAAIWMLLVFPALAALVMSSGIRFRLTGHWAHIVLPVIFSGVVIGWLYVYGF